MMREARIVLAASPRPRALVAARGATLTSGRVTVFLKRPENTRGRGGATSPEKGVIATIDTDTTEPTRRYLIIESDNDAILATISDVARGMGASVTTAANTRRR